MRPDDSDYYRARAIEERWLARDTDEPLVAAIHAQLAYQYDALADRIAPLSEPAANGTSPARA
jgi:hypothetical protein